MEADRFRERLAGLDHAALLSYAAEVSIAHRHTADVILAKHSPLPAWARDNVMLSADLLPRVFASLEAKEAAAACVCHAWKAAWVATNDGRRGLRPVALPKPDFPCDSDTCLAALPDGNLFVQPFEGVARILDAGFNELKVFENLWPIFEAVASELGFYAICDGTSGADVLRRLDLDDFSDWTHEYDPDFEESEDHRYSEMTFPTLAPGGLLVALGKHDQLDDEIVCFDARTVEVLRRFGRGRFNTPGQSQVQGMAACGDKLFVSDAGSCTIQVFSLAGGAYLTAIDSGCAKPGRLCHFDARLYLHADDDDENTFIRVLTPEGERLQVWRPDPSRGVRDLYGIYDHKLLMLTDKLELDDDGQSMRLERGLEALQGI